MKHKKLVIVEWVDSTGPPDYWWHRGRWNGKPLPITTVGFLLTKQKDYITVASSTCSDDDDAPGGCITIPIGAIKRTEIAKRGRRGKR